MVLKKTFDQKSINFSRSTDIYAQYWRITKKVWFFRFSEWITIDWPPKIHWKDFNSIMNIEIFSNRHLSMNGIQKQLINHSCKIVIKDKIDNQMQSLAIFTHKYLELRSQNIIPFQSSLFLRKIIKHFM